jgi:hypothetical protein
MVKSRMSPSSIGSGGGHLKNMPPWETFINIAMPAEDLPESGEWIRYAIDKSTSNLGYLRFSLIIIIDPDMGFSNLGVKRRWLWPRGIAAETLPVWSMDTSL